MRHTRILSAAALCLVAGGMQAIQAQGRGQDQQTKPGQKQDEKKAPAKPVPPQEQQQRVQQEQQRTTQYKQHLAAQVPVAQKQVVQLQQQKRPAQAKTQQQYAAQLQQQQQRVQTPHDYSHDPYVSTPHTYQYVVGGASHQTNEYGADVLRQAVNNGYQQGFQAGQADHQDHRRSDYASSFGYTDANYGFSGNYVDRPDYNYYFREGFRRGYDDGFNQRWQYGSSSNGTPVILAALAATILGLKSLK